MTRKAHQISINIRGDKEVLALLEQLPKLVVMSGGPIDTAIGKALQIVAKRARQLAPDSRRTGSRLKQSKKSRAIWTGKLNRLIRTKVVKHATGAWGVVGPKNPEGNMAHFMQEEPRRQVLWGKMTKLQKYRIARNWITQAYDETVTEQKSAVVASLKSDIDRHMRGGG